MKKPTQKAIQKEIEALKKISPKLPESYFGDDNSGAVKAQIMVLERGMTEDEIYEKWDDDENTYIRDSAYSAMQWMNGDSFDGNPSEEWKTLL